MDLFFCGVLANTYMAENKTPQAALKKKKNNTLPPQFLFVSCTHLRHVFQHRQRIEVNNGKLHQHQNGIFSKELEMFQYQYICTRKIKVSDAFRSQIIAQIATLGSTRGHPHKPQYKIRTTLTHHTSLNLFFFF